LFRILIISLEEKKSPSNKQLAGEHFRTTGLRIHSLYMAGERMSQVVIENAIINSPFDEPTRHFRFTGKGTMT
jgi:hypothetical protein